MKWTILASSIVKMHTIFSNNKFQWIFVRWTKNYDHIVWKLGFTSVVTLPIDANKHTDHFCVSVSQSSKLYRFQSSGLNRARLLHGVFLFRRLTWSLRPNRPKRCGSRKVTRCASWSRLRMNIRGSDRGGRKKKCERFVSDRHRLSRLPRECVSSFSISFIMRHDKAASFLHISTLFIIFDCNVYKNDFQGWNNIFFNIHWIV